MNKDRVEGKAKDIAGRVERQAGEWTGDPKKQVSGAGRQVEGKLQNAWGQAKDARKDAADDAKATSKPPRRTQDGQDEEDREESATR
ncbi:MAG: CsbD family protein [Candidatus Sulfotelmatobacter sp.]